jgi:hypothetical protein
MKKLKVGETNRGFQIVEFEDEYGEKCSLQKSSWMEKDAIWFGTVKPQPRILACKVNGGIPDGWVDYKMPEGVEIHTRMHLTRDIVKQLLPLLQNFVKTGELQ